MGGKPAAPRRKVQVWIFSEQGQCLLLLTRAARGAFWQPVTGSVEPGEDFRSAACREASEETGLPFAAEPSDVEHEFEFHSRFGLTREKTFALLVASAWPPRLDPNEHQAYEWLDPRAALARLKFPSNAEGLKKAYRAVFGSPLHPKE